MTQAAAGQLFAVATDDAQAHDGPPILRRPNELHRRQRIGYDFRDDVSRRSGRIDVGVRVRIGAADDRNLAATLHRARIFNAHYGRLAQRLTRRRDI